MIALNFSQEIVTRLEQELQISENTNNLRLYKKISCLLMISQGLHFRVILDYQVFNLDEPS